MPSPFRLLPMRTFSRLSLLSRTTCAASTPMPPGCLKEILKGVFLAHIQTMGACEETQEALRRQDSERTQLLEMYAQVTSKYLAVLANYRNLQGQRTASDARYSTSDHDVNAIPARHCQSILPAQSLNTLRMGRCAVWRCAVWCTGPRSWRRVCTRRSLKQMS